MQDGAPVSSAGRKLERVSNGAPRGMAATRGASSDAARAQNPAYRPALPSHSCKKPARLIRTAPAFSFTAASLDRDDLERMRDLGRLADHDRRRAVLVVRKVDRALHGGRVEVLAGHGEVEVDLREDLRV